MRMRLFPSLGAAVLLAAGAGQLAAQALPTTQPKVLQIFRERLKPGMSAAHEKNEIGWPQAFAEAKYPNYYLAVESMTGDPEVLYLAPFDSYTAWGKADAVIGANATLSAALDRLAAADAAYVESMDVIEAVAAPELGHGAFPDLNKQRFWDISVWRIRPGHGKAFAEAVAAYVKVVTRAGGKANWRTYRVTGGMPGGTYLMFSSVASFAEFDAVMADDAMIGQAMTPDEQAYFAKFFKESVAYSESNKYRLSPTMSYVAPETKAADPAFWNTK
ncbi:MAG TPA: hypothetical protein VK845_15340 [Gemmatimonadales bacterium]|nr:hypothetical protein [Gemmatimonadales bacterium]